MEHDWRDKATFLILIGGLVLIALILLIKPKSSSFSRTQSQQEDSTLSPPSQVPPQDSLPEYRFPMAICGDSDPGGSNNWYPVFVNYSEKNLRRIRTNYCNDAILKYRQKLKLHSIQVASFIDKSRAETFAEIMRREVGSGEVGEPTQLQTSN